jgi:hypothetical protein
MPPVLSKGREFWGRPSWKTLHFFAASYKPCQREKFKRFVEYFGKFLCCDKCKHNYERHLKEIPIDPYLSNSSDLLFWTYLLHDEVNKETGKVSPPYKEVRHYYSSEENKDEWEGAMWHTLHSFCATYKECQREDFKVFIRYFTEFLCCDKFRQKYQQCLEKAPIDPYLSNNSDLFFWSYLIHDLQNKEANKVSPPYKDFRQYYFSALGNECPSCKVEI